MSRPRRPLLAGGSGTRGDRANGIVGGVPVRLVRVSVGVPEDGTSHHYLPAGEVVRADPGLTALLTATAVARGVSPVCGRSWTIDAPYRVGKAGLERRRAAGVAVIEMEAAAIFAVARVHGIRAALIVAVSDELFDDWTLGFDEAAYLEALLKAVDVVMDVAAQIGST